ncbi:MAG: hypothetical protein BGO78_07655 [Chloroflexi bacterium 44-23]|nr:MAG: hypothetical protein BGO78_07655 [Chloroflexi bacterium 44-23]
MDSATKIVQKRMKIGWSLLVIGLLVILTGILAEIFIQNQPFNLRSITGLGFVFIASGAGMLAKYRRAIKDETTARRMLVAAGDERTVIIRSRAGHSAFWVAMVITYALLQYVSFASNGSLPGLSEDQLWYILSGAVVIPFGVYVVGIMVGERKQ